MFEKVVDCKNLPTLPAVAVELLEKTRDPDVQLGEIAKLVMTDQGLASRVLRTVNSSFYGLSQPCTTIDRALGLLGLKAIKSLVLGFSMVRVTTGVDAGALDLAQYWRRTICTATAARQIALITGGCDPDEAFTAGLFIDVGVLASFVAIPKQYGAVLSAAPEAHAKLSEVESAQLGFTHAEVGASMTKKWGMSSHVVQAIRHHHDTERDGLEDIALVRAVALGQFAADAMLATNPAQPMADLMVHAKQWFGQDHAEVEALLDGVSSAAMELADILDQEVGEIPDAQQILARANDQLVEQQILAQREAQQLHERAQRLEAQTLTDALTGAKNRKCFDVELAELYETTRGLNKPLAVLFVDADRFKSVNDTHGHKAGDAVLVQLAQRMMSLVGKLGSVCRYGGEEFAVLLPRASAEKASRFGELIRKAIEDRPFDLRAVEGAPESLAVTVSIGVSASDPSRVVGGAGAIVLEADKAVYAAKRAGRNRVVCYSSSVGREQGAVEGSSPSPAALGPGEGGAVRGGVNVLLVEDDPICAGCLRAAFAGASVSVTLVTSCGDALEILRRHAEDASGCPDIIVCEHDLPDGTSGALIRAAKACQALKHVQVLVVTSATNPNIPGAARAAGADGVYLKADIAGSLDHWARRVIKQAGVAAAAAA